MSRSTQPLVGLLRRGRIRLAEVDGSPVEVDHANVATVGLSESAQGFTTMPTLNPFSRDLAAAGSSRSRGEAPCRTQ